MDRGKGPVTQDFMARKLKAYQTSLGFFDLAIAAPSMKAALQAWGSNSNLFHQGVAKETEDPKVVAATMAKPGVVLRRPVGTGGRFAEHAALPTDLAGDVNMRSQRHRPKSKKQPPTKTSETAARRAALEYERTERHRQSERRKQEAGRAKERQRRETAIAKAQTALDKAKREHDAKAGAIEAERAALENRSHAEEARWEKRREKLDAALRRARD
jgi:colicin import membrane protein